MDPVNKQTLDLIEQSMALVPMKRWGLHLMPVVADYIRDDDILNARRVLQKIPLEFVDGDNLVAVTADNKILRDAVCLVIVAFGLDFHLLLKPVTDTV